MAERLGKMESPYLPMWQSDRALVKKLGGEDCGVHHDWMSRQLAHTEEFVAGVLDE